MVTTINRNILKFAVGRQMFCPHCERILDAKTAANVEVSRGGKIALDITMCGECFDKIRQKVEELAAGSETTLQVLDGRVLWEKRTA